MSDMNRQQLCAALGVSESTIRRLEINGLPVSNDGSRRKSYSLSKCKEWLLERFPRQVHQSVPDAAKRIYAKAGITAFKNVPEPRSRKEPT